MGLVVVATALVLLGGTQSQTGLYGTVSLGPIRPVCVAELPCSRPARGVTIVFLRGSERATTVTSSTGTYRVLLRPGVYSVRASRLGRPLGRVRPAVVTVAAGRVARQGLAIESGLR
jgi:hypothetical protein